MKKILFLQNLFAYNDYFFERALASFKSVMQLLEYPLHDDISVDMFFGGYFTKDEHFEEIDLILQSNDMYHKLKRYDCNYGKGHIINDLQYSHFLNMMFERPDYIFTMDSDLIIKSPNGFFSRLLDAHGAAGRKLARPSGILSVDQEGNRRHQDEWIDTDLGDGIWRSSRNAGIAGGAILIDFPLWNQLGGYRVYGPYGGHDGDLLHRATIAGGFLCLHTADCVEHPEEYDKDYDLFKKAMLSKCVQNNMKSLDFSEMMDRIIETDKFLEK